jgi:hypothetical protein
MHLQFQQNLEPHAIASRAAQDKELTVSSLSARIPALASGQSNPSDHTKNVAESSVDTDPNPTADLNFEKDFSLWFNDDVAT